MEDQPCLDCLPAPVPSVFASASGRPDGLPKPLPVIVLPGHGREQDRPGDRRSPAPLDLASSVGGFRQLYAGMTIAPPSPQALQRGPVTP